jgi:hypothetical protein
VQNVLRKNVLMLLIPSMARFFIDVGSFWPPKPGSVAEARDQPTFHILVWVRSYEGEADGW